MLLSEQKSQFIWPPNLKLGNKNKKGDRNERERFLIVDNIQHKAA